MLRGEKIARHEDVFGGEGFVVKRWPDGDRVSGGCVEGRLGTVAVGWWKFRVRWGLFVLGFGLGVGAGEFAVRAGGGFEVGVEGEGFPGVVGIVGVLEFEGGCDAVFETLNVCPLLVGFGTEGCELCFELLFGIGGEERIDEVGECVYHDVDTMLCLRRISFFQLSGCSKERCA